MVRGGWSDGFKPSERKIGNMSLGGWRLYPDEVGHSIDRAIICVAVRAVIQKSADLGVHEQRMQ